MKHIISLGAGVQSSTMALMAAHGEIAPMPEAAIFADTQAEPESVYRWLDWLETQLPFPVHRVTKGNLEEAALKMRTTEDGGKISSVNVPFFALGEDGKRGRITHRNCTIDYKIMPIQKRLRSLCGIRHGQKDVGVIQWIGISLDEATRMKPARPPWIENRWPLIELGMRRSDCIEWMRSKGYPDPPRSSCVFCPFHNNHEWRRLRDEEPQEFIRAVKLESKLAAARESENFSSTLYLHRECVPLDQVDLSTAEERGQLNLFENECEGMCGV